MSRSRARRYSFGAMGGDTSYVPPVGTLPGQASNRTGHTVAPGYPGSLTTHATTGWVSGVPGTPTVYSFFDVDVGTGSMTLTGLHDISFVGCRFQSNNQGGWCVQPDGANVTFSYCSFTPRTIYYTSPPGLVIWPSAASGTNTTNFVAGVNCIQGTRGYQYGIMPTNSCSNLIVQYCDFWGYGQDALDLAFSTTNTILFNNCWVHDAAEEVQNTYHTDGVGYMNGGNGVANFTVTNCTIASLGNANGISFQASTTPYNNITVVGNYVAGFGLTIDPFHGSATNCTVTDNIISVSPQWYFGPIYGDPTALFTATTNIWRRNKLVVPTGCVQSGTSSISFTTADNNKFILPNSTFSITDFTG